MSYIYVYNAITSKLDLVNPSVVIAYYLLLENADKMLKEDGGALLLEG